MTLEEAIKLADDAAPELVMKTAGAVAALETIAPGFVPDVLAEFEEVATYVSEKTAANWGGLGTSIGGAVLGGLGVSIAGDLYDVAKRGLSAGKNFRRIMEANPSLKHDVDPARLKPAFDAIHRYAPEMTADPMVGGSLLRAITELPPGSEHSLISNIITARKNLGDARKSHIRLENQPYSKEFQDGGSSKGPLRD